MQDAFVGPVWGGAILPEDEPSGWSCGLERRLRPRLAAPRREVCGIGRERLFHIGTQAFGWLSSIINSFSGNMIK
jgi:hypothetical protein